ncbi:hypothetical protein [Alteromonas sp. ASW11-130]|uniref:hypothetical protein n=1 Tax=Alteromonas sp. ASW11-130 TaxID=3015775 RepID=UPI002241D04F|nr:hypothetical protein [Alteromonas sp. ASW11-130]MCW8091290.1 hypothetical protein [Alteromonas sp. ASW11-130]
MAEHHQKLNKGFLLTIPLTPEAPSWRSTFSKHHKLNGAALYFDDDYSKNVVITCADDGLTIYKGDRHLYNSFRERPEKLASLTAGQLTGTLITYNNSTQLLTVQSDFLGSEPLYYLKTNDTFWLTDRIDNFSRFRQCKPDLTSVYALVTSGATLGSRTILEGVKQTGELQTLTFNSQTGKLTNHVSKRWRSNPKAPVDDVTERISDKLKSILCDIPDSALMLSAGWDSRVLMSEPSHIQHTYTHGDLSSREIDIAFRLGQTLDAPMSFVPSRETRFGADLNNEMLQTIGQCFFPHWYQAGKYISQLNNLPVMSGMFVEHFSGHYGLNIVPGPNRKTRVLRSFLYPAYYDRMSDQEAIELLTTLNSKGFDRLPWFLNSSVDFDQIQTDFSNQIRTCLTDYTQTGTSGVQELCERYKMQHIERQFMANQTKSFSCFSGYHHPYADSEFSELVLQLKYKHRIGYKLSKQIVKTHNPKLLNIPLAATLVKAKSPIFLQEMSRFVRITGEAVYNRFSQSTLKGLGWNNFQYLSKTNVFHEYVDNLKHDLWDKRKMHDSIDEHLKGNNDAYSLIVTLGRIATVDYQLMAHRY